MIIETTDQMYIFICARARLSDRHFVEIIHLLTDRWAYAHSQTSGFKWAK